MTLSFMMHRHTICKVARLGEGDEEAKEHGGEVVVGKALKGALANP